MYVGLFKRRCAVIYRTGVLQRVELVGLDSWFGRTGWSAHVHSVGFRFRVGLPGASQFAESELFFFIRHVVKKCFWEGFPNLVDTFFVVGHFECRGVFLCIVGFFVDVGVDEAYLGADSTDIVSNAMSEGFTCRTLYLVAEFEISTAVAVAVAVLVAAVFAGVAAKSIDVWSYRSCGGVLIRFKGVDEVHFLEFGW